MRTIRHGATALITSVLLVTSCGPRAEPGSGGASEGGTPVSEETSPAPRVLTLEVVDELLAAGELQRAVDRIAAERDENALEPALADRMVRALWALDEVPRAVRVARGALALDAGATAVANELAGIYMSLNQNAKAVETLRAAREGGASDADVALTLGVCLGRMEDLEGAREEFERAAAAGAPRQDVDYNMAVLLMGEDRHQEAEELLQGVVDAHPESLDARRELARLYLGHRPEQDGRLEAAAVHLNAVLDRRENDWRAYELMGDHALAVGDPVAAVTYFTEALRYGKNPPRVEDKYRSAALARNALLEEQGLIEPEPEVERPSPPIPLGVQERWKQAAKERREQAQDGAPEDGSGGEQGQ